MLVDTARRTLDGSEAGPSSTVDQPQDEADDDGHEDHRSDRYIDLDMVSDDTDIAGQAAEP